MAVITCSSPDPRILFFSLLSMTCHFEINSSDFPLHLYPSTRARARAHTPTHKHTHRSSWAPNARPLRAGIAAWFCSQLYSQCLARRELTPSVTERGALTPPVGAGFALRRPPFSSPHPYSRPKGAQGGGVLFIPSFPPSWSCWFIR